MADPPKNHKAGFKTWIDFFLKNDLKQKETADLCVFTELLRHCVNLAYNYAPQNHLGNKKTFQIVLR